MQFVVTVDWVIKPDHIDAFSALAKKQAENSVNLETDCTYFDLCQDLNNPARFFMYELYKDKAAFDLHLASGHFTTFSDEIADMVISKDVRTLETV